MALASDIMRAVRRINAQSGAAVFLTYHRVGSFDYDIQNLSISFERFNEQLTEFTKRYQLMTAGEVFAHHAAGTKLPRKALVLTFDDGYRDLVNTIAPALEDHYACASFFITSHRSEPYWWDQLSYLTPKAEDLKGWRITDAPHNDAQRYYAQEAAKLAQMSNLERRTHLSELRKVNDEYLESMNFDGSEAEEVIMKRVAAEVARLSDEDLQHLSTQAHIEIGAHSIDHPRLSLLSHAEQEEQIKGSKKALEEIIGKPVNSFSYPYGTFDAVSSDTIDLVKAAGFTGALSTELASFKLKLPFGALYSTSGNKTRYFTPRIATLGKSTAQLIAEIDKLLAL